MLQIFKYIIILFVVYALNLMYYYMLQNELLRIIFPLLNITFHSIRAYIFVKYIKLIYHFICKFRK